MQFCIMEKIIIAQLSVNEKKVEQFLGFAKTMIKKSKQETGCLTYRLLNEIDKPNEFIVYEKYVNQKAVELHNSSEHLEVFLKSVSTLLIDKPIIDIY